MLSKRPGSAGREDRAAMPNKPELDALDKRLLNKLQWDFPLVPRPFRALAESLGRGTAGLAYRVQRHVAEVPW